MRKSTAVSSSFIDTHTHLTMEEFSCDREQVLQRALEAGVEEMIVVASHLPESEEAIRLASRHSFLRVAIGIHPHEAKDFSPSAWDRLRSLSREEAVVAIGETGLDYHYHHSPRELQKEVFRRHIRWARENHLPLIVHSREAQSDTLAILREEKAEEVGGVFHCFSGDWEAAQAAASMGFFLSVAGPVTYPNSRRLRQIVASLPAHRLLLETDCPYLAPQALRGKRNEPAYLPLIAAAVAEIKGVTLADVARFTSANARILLGLGLPPPAGATYVIRNSLYLNLTNRCPNSCIFCPRLVFTYVMGHNLQLSREPTLPELLSAVKDAESYQEVVFCGFGEPLLRLEEVKQVARALKGRGLKVRINTNGLANLVHQRNIVPELAGLVDAISVSLNAENAEKYQELCRPPWGKESYGALKLFIREAKRYLPRVIATAVDHPAIDAERCRQVAQTELGVEFRLRPLQILG